MHHLVCISPRGSLLLSFLAGKSPYDDLNGPVFMRAKLSLLSDVGEGITVPSFISQVGHAARQLLKTTPGSLH